jgi:hypothetical protein
VAALFAHRDSSELKELLPRAVIQVGNIGTAFLVDEKRALTCAHLFSGYPGAWKSPPETVSLRFGALTGSARVVCLRNRENPGLPDLALLEGICWGPTDKTQATADVRFLEDLRPLWVILEDAWTTGSHYVSWGHPEGRFQQGDSLWFEYKGPPDSVDPSGLSYKKLSCTNPTVRGFSGSPILNTKTGKICGVLAISLDLNEPKGARAVPISYAFDYFPEIRDVQRNLYKQESPWTSSLPNAAYWRVAKAACADRMVSMLDFSAYAESRFYQKRAMEDTFHEFVRSNAKAMAIVGESGMGKTTLLVRLVSETLRTGNLCAMFHSGVLPFQPSAVETHLANELGRKHLADRTISNDEFWTAIDEEGERIDKHLLVFIDAINEYNQQGYDPRPVHLLDEANRIIVNMRTKFNRVKFVITCRPETWRRAMDSAPTRFSRSGGDYYFSPQGAIAWILTGFSTAELEGAYDKYRTVAGITTSFGDLSDQAKLHLRDPFLLRLASLAYKHGSIPPNLDTGVLFRIYFDDLKDVQGKDLRPFIEELVDEMFVGDQNVGAIQRTAFPVNRDLKERRPIFFSDLDFSDPHSPGFELREKNVIREWLTQTESNEYKAQIRFTYDRFGQYLLAKRLTQLIMDREKSGVPLPDAANSIFIANVSTAQRDPAVLAVLQQTLSQLARTAQTERGVSLLRLMVEQLARRQPNTGDRVLTIDWVYCMLRDEDYRLWLRDREDNVRNAHLNIFYDRFTAGFRDDDPAITAASIRYVFLLWGSSSTHGYSDGLSIASRLAMKVTPPWRMAFSTANRRSFSNLITLMVLVLSEAPMSRFMDAVGVTQRMMHNLKLNQLERIARFLIDTVLSRFFLRTLEGLPNPIQLTALKTYFTNRHAYLPIVEEVLELLDPACDPNRMNVQTLERLSQCGDSFILQMLTFVISANYERAGSPEARAAALSLVGSLFYDAPRSESAEYCASIALYHINSFGSHPSTESMRLMDLMAHSILTDRKGRFSISGRRYNFNIIGTYGRALRRNGVDTAMIENPSHSTLQYVLYALQLAKQSNDVEFYLYICENLGLLGLLVEPTYLFDVFTLILSDAHALDEPILHRDLPFSPVDMERINDLALQSLTNIRSLYRQEVDRYLLEVLQKPELYKEIAISRKPDYRLSFLLSWAFEQLMFRCFVYHYEKSGREMVQSFLDVARCRTAEEGFQALLLGFIKGLAKLSG